MKILGLSMGELSTAAVMVDGEIKACVSQERFSRKKNDESYPKDAIEYCLKAAGIKGKDLDDVVIASEMADLWHRLTHYYSTFKIQDYIDEQRTYWRPTLYEKKKIAWHDLYKDRWDLKQYPGNWSELLGKLGDGYYLDEKGMKLVNEHIVDTIHNHIGVPKDRFSFSEHHSTHAAYAYFASPFRDKKTLVITFDAFGDGLSATISEAEGHRIRRIKAIDHKDFLLARIYRYTTLILGMKPNEHEYKVMGLAPYAKPQVYEKAYQVYKSTMYVDGLDFKFHDRPADTYHYFKERLEGCRFDGIAGGLQKFTEEILTTWVRNAIKHTGIRRVVFSGGVSMNVKAMKEIAALPDVEEMFIPPSGGDESLAIGACYLFCSKKFDRDAKKLDNAYLGADVDSADVAEVVRRVRDEKKPYKVVEGVTAARVAAQLAAGRVVGRCAGRMEFGARSLGNRSILADPRSSEMVAVINHKIKNRDFWMPFAPAMLKSKSAEYIVNPKKLDSPFMTTAFDSTPAGWPKMVAAAHPADRSVRAQLVTKEASPGFAAVIEEFEKLTGSAVVLNTSFNLHGEPIVATAQDAFRVFELTQIDDLVIGDVLISKTA